MPFTQTVNKTPNLSGQFFLDALLLKGLVLLVKGTTLSVGLKKFNQLCEKQLTDKYSWSYALDYLGLYIWLQRAVFFYQGW